MPSLMPHQWHAFSNQVLDITELDHMGRRTPPRTMSRRGDIHEDGRQTLAMLRACSQRGYRKDVVAR